MPVREIYNKEKEDQKAFYLPTFYSLLKMDLSLFTFIISVIAVIHLSIK